MSLNRRELLGAIPAGVGMAASFPDITTAEEPDASVVIEDQTSDGQSIVISELSTEVQSPGFVYNEADEQLDVVGGLRFDAGESVEDYTVRLAEPIEETQTISVILFESNGPVIARDSAFVQLDDDDREYTPGIDPTLIEADPEAGFNYPYYLYAPRRPLNVDPRPLLVESNNTGTSTDDFEQHRERAEQLLVGRRTQQIASSLDAPALVPVFPRPRNDPVNWEHYVHQLDDTTMSIEDGPLERVDLQLLSMVDDARERLEAEGYPVDDDGIMLNGFSASGNFADRFTVLHPEHVQSVTAGGLNGMPILPLEAFDGRELPYHVGIANVEELTGDPVDHDALDDVDQFLYMGGDDDNDTIPFDDAWTDDSLRQLALDVYGEEMIDDRFVQSQAAYVQAGVDAQFRVYDGADHTPRPAMDDIVEFHRRSIEGESVAEFGEQIGVSVVIDAPSRVDPGTEVTFDASDSKAVSDIESFSWQFEDGSTATGEVVTRLFEEPGEYEVILEVVTGDGRTTERVKQIIVESSDHDSETEEGDGSETDASGERDSADSDATDSESGHEDDSVPGFGILGSIGALGGAGYLLRRRWRHEEH